MGLEQDIKQKRPFNSQKEKALVNLLFTYNWVNAKLIAYLKPHGITPTQYNILRILNGADQPLSTAAIRDRMLNNMSDITRIIDRLIKKEYVLKKTRPNDKRLVDITITKGGEKILSDIYDQGHLSHVMMKGLTEEEGNTLNVLLDKLRI